MHYIGQDVSERMNMLKIKPKRLADETFMDIKDINDILQNRVPLDAIDEFDLKLICSVLHCKPEYFINEDVKKRDLLISTMNRGNDEDKSVNVKAKLQDFISDFAFVNEVLAEVR